MQKDQIFTGCNIFALRVCKYWHTSILIRRPAVYMPWDSETEKSQWQKNVTLSLGIFALKENVSIELTHTKKFSKLGKAKKKVSYFPECSLLIFKSPVLHLPENAYVLGSLKEISWIESCRLPWNTCTHENKHHTPANIDTSRWETENSLLPLLRMFPLLTKLPATVLSCKNSQDYDVRLFGGFSLFLFYTPGQTYVSYFLTTTWT